MPIDHKKTSTYLSQRGQYQKGGMGRWYWDYKDNHIFNLIKPEQKNILDIGCGEGITLEKLTKQYLDKNVAGIDIIPENVTICKQHNLPVSLDSVYDLKTNNSSVDVCILSDIIEHLDNIELALENVRRILKPSGEMIIIFPNDRNFFIARLLFLKFKEALADPGHVIQLAPKKIKLILKKTGFEIMKISNVPFKFWFLCLHSIVLAKKI
jgi:2-polyprenyl-3-methyl-5-hydroxy-6-metoxy-1,4-benzoquinol methylase